MPGFRLNFISVSKVRAAVIVAATGLLLTACHFPIVGLGPVTVSPGYHGHGHGYYKGYGYGGYRHGRQRYRRHHRRGHRY